MPRKTLAISVVALFLGFLPSAYAGTVIYTNLTSFLGKIEPGYYLEDFQSVAQGIYTTTKLFSSSGYSYEAYAPHRLSFQEVAGSSTNKIMSLNSADDPISISFLSGNVLAVGGYFGDDGFSGATETQVRVQVNDGTFMDINTPGINHFIGFISTDGTPITSLTVQSKILYQNPGWSWAAVDNLYVGSNVPEPTSLLLFGTGLFGIGLAAWRKKK